LLAAESGLAQGKVVRRFNCFHATSAEGKVAKDLFIQSVNFVAVKSDRLQSGPQGYLY
jgi:hypothetical protein